MAERRPEGAAPPAPEPLADAACSEEEAEVRKRPEE